MPEVHEPWWPSRFGADDQLGMLNHINADKRLAALGLVREGRLYDLGHVLDQRVPVFPGRFFHQTLVTTAHHVNAHRDHESPGGLGENKVNWLTELIATTMQLGTHIDALNHLQIGDRGYNGWTVAELAETWGTNRLGAETIPQIVTRGFLVDVPGVRGVGRLEAGDVITIDEVQRALSPHEPCAGDAVLFHTGWSAHWDEPEAYPAGEPGPGLELAAWLAGRGVALTGCDTWSYGPIPAENPARPFEVPQTLNVRHGVFRHHGGISPAWPLPYEEFEPYYTAAEHLYQVHGQHGVDPTDPPASSDYPHPPVSHEHRIQALADQLKRAGYHPFPLPVGVLLEERNGRPTHASRCIRCDTFDGFPCLVNGKSDAQVLCIEPALTHANVQLETRAYVKRLRTDASGRQVTGVVVDHDGAEETCSADLVVVSCGAINSAALLLRSATDRHPQGLANGSGVVGRHYMRHNNSAVMAVSREPNPTVFQKTLGINDFYFHSEDWSYPLGHIQLLGKSDGEMVKGEAPDWAVWKPNMPLDTLARHALDFWLTSEDLPDPDNRVTLNARGEIVLHLKDTNVESHRRLLATLKGMLGHMGCQAHLLPRSLYLGRQIPIGGTAHQCGTVRFGTDPATSALDINCRAHELDNLYVVDGSFFVSSGAVNPALTIMANALRVGDHLLERLGSTRRVVPASPAA